MKKFCTTALAATIAILSAFPLLSACVPADDWQGYSDEQLGETEIRYDVRDGAGYLRWAEVEDAEGYNVYRSESRFGEYRLVNSSPVNEARYKSTAYCYWYYKITALTTDGEEELGVVSAFSDDTLIISPDDDMVAVQAHIDAVHDTLETGSTGQFSDGRFAMLLLPGEYPDLDVKLGYYTTASGLGDTPADVTVGSLYVSTNVLANQNATCTFWRGAENMTVDGDTRWAVSQATSLRRMQINGDLTLSGEGDGAWSSGGFLANSAVTGTVNPGSQQQWFSRNDELGGWEHTGGYNYVFSGCYGNLPVSVWNSGSRATVLDSTEKIAEKPFLVQAGSGYNVFVPEVQSQTKGVTWANGINEEAGRFVPLDSFYIANERDTSETLNAALDKGLNLLFPAGHYKLDTPIEIKRENTVVLGLGYATLEISDTNADCAIKVADVGGVRLADLLIDAGAYSKNMVVVGEKGGNASHADNPIVISNMFLRIGGVENVHTETDTAMVIYANDTVGDNFWIWRADHSRGVQWQDIEAYDYYNEEGELVQVEAQYGNPVNTGILVEGDYVVCYALMVEHCEGYQTDWQGENGMTVMYQSETPYRVPSQDLWMSDNGKRGCASYRVGGAVQNHRAYGIGIYLVNYSGVTLDSAIEVPEYSGISMSHLVISDFSGNDPSSIINVINDYGGGVGGGISMRLVESYPLNTRLSS